MFDAAADFTTGEVVEYRRVMFPPLLGDSMHVPFFSIEDAPGWMTARGYALYQELNPAERLDPLQGHRYASLRQLRAYREQVVGEAYVHHPFFQVDLADDWVAPAPFNTWMQVTQELEELHPWFVCRRQPSSISHHLGASDQCSLAAVIALVLVSHFVPLSHLLSYPIHTLAPATALDLVSHLAPLPHLLPLPLTSISHQDHYVDKLGKGNGKGKPVEEDLDPRIKVTRELYVDRLIPVTTAPKTWTVPHDEAAYKLDVRANTNVLKNKKGNKMRTIDAYIKAEDQDAWDGSTGHAGPKGDVWVYAFTGERVRARRAQVRCKGICVCEFRWNHELDANEREAASPEAILSRFYTRVISSKCKTECDGVPFMILLNNGPNQYGKLYFIGCSKWHPEKRWLHRYHSIPPNVDEEIFRYVLENKGRVPDGTVLNLNVQCVLSTHPRLGLKHCGDHVLDGVIHPAKLLQRRCDTELIILIPVLPPDDPTSTNYYEWLPEYAFQAILILRNGHNHPAHPHIKPSAEDERLLLPPSASQFSAFKTLAF
ncbi:hypothetical protein DFH08DRAFT_971348 [Mycena albidolilacea]|uniref:Uncharacterized protein n=1 Tax=Mycena albidolilacea TaxID=1033008 RepID=A0AAD7EF98_9AGAR|nr:hypothetical protein DFH08DRAFT_971348 [Mycena albidolilacea]